MFSSGSRFHSDAKRALASLMCLAMATQVGLFTAHAQTKQDPDYVAGLAAWRDGRFVQASEHLARYRVSAAYGKSYDIDYLLGTAWCRMEGMATKGASLLDWAMQQDMPLAAAQQFKLELTRCQQRIAQASAASAVAVSAPKPEWLVRTSVGAGASIRASGKMFYVVGGDKGAFAATPLEIVRPMAESEYESRLFALDATQAAMQAAKQRLGPSYKVLAAGRFLLASPSHSEADLKRIADRLENFAGFLEAAYGIRFAPKYISVYLAPTGDKLAAAALKLHGLRAGGMTLGYTFQNDLSVSAVMQTTAAGTLLHELFHLGVRATFGDIPSWLDESMASLYETSVVSDGVYAGAPNWRGDVVREMGWGRRFRLVDLVGQVSQDRVRAAREGGDRLTNVAHNDEAAYEAALGRYFALYLQEKGKLGAVYKAFMNRPEWVADMPAVTASMGLIEMAVGQGAPAIEADFLAWLKEATKNRNWQPNKVPTGGEQVPKELPPKPPTESGGLPNDADGSRLGG